MVLTVVLLGLAALNAICAAWATVLDTARASALARALGASPGQVTAAIAAAQVLPAVPGVLLGIPLGIELFAVAAQAPGWSSRPHCGWPRRDRHHGRARHAGRDPGPCRRSPASLPGPAGRLGLHAQLELPKGVARCPTFREPRDHGPAAALRIRAGVLRDAALEVRDDDRRDPGESTPERGSHHYQVSERTRVRETIIRHRG